MCIRDRIYGVDRPIVFDGLDFEDFSKFSGKVRIHNARNSENYMAVAFSACNGIKAIYERDGKIWQYVGPSQTMVACERALIDKSGKQVILGTAMIADYWFKKLAPDIINYDVSGDGRTLTLLGASGEQLGLFTRPEAAE